VVAGCQNWLSAARHIPAVGCRWIELPVVLLTLWQGAPCKQLQVGDQDTAYCCTASPSFHIAPASAPQCAGAHCDAYTSTTEQCAGDVGPWACITSHRRDAAVTQDCMCRCTICAWRNPLCSLTDKQDQAVGGCVRAHSSLYKVCGHKWCAFTRNISRRMTCIHHRPRVP
jgi:hypothetical protein